MIHSSLLMTEAKFWKTQRLKHQNFYDDSNDVLKVDTLLSLVVKKRGESLKS